MFFGCRGVVAGLPLFLSSRPPGIEIPPQSLCVLGELRHIRLGLCLSSASGRESLKLTTSQVDVRSSLSSCFSSRVHAHRATVAT